jgi:hypothetical protein
LKGGLLVGGEGREEGEMAGDEHLRDTGGLGGEWDCVIRWEAKDGRKKAVSSFIRGSARMRRDLGMGEDTETSQADREGDDGSVLGKRAGRRAEGEDGALEKGVQLMPNLCQVIRLELALQMAEVLLDATLGEDKGGLERKVGEAGDDVNLLLNHLGEKAETEGARAHSRAE